MTGTTKALSALKQEIQNVMYENDKLRRLLSVIRVRAQYMSEWFDAPETREEANEILKAIREVGL